MDLCYHQQTRPKIPIAHPSSSSIWISKSKALGEEGIEMERVSTFITSSPGLRPSCFFSNNGVFPQSNKLLHPIPETTSFRNKPISVKATNRNTLSTSTIAAPLMPRLDDLDTTNMLLRQRIVFLGSQVDEASADLVISQLLLLDAEDPTKDIKFFIHSPGGSTTSGMGIYDAMKLCKADISTVCMGIAASITGLLLASGTKGKRFCMPNGRVMLHHPLGRPEGDFLDVFLRIREINYQRNKVIKILSRITGKPLEQIDKDMLVDNFMNAWEAKEYGLIDGVIDDGKPGLVAPIADSSPPPIPLLWHEWTNDSDDRKNIPSEEKLLDEPKELQASDEENGEATTQGNEVDLSLWSDETITDIWKMPNYDHYLHQVQFQKILAYAKINPEFQEFLCNDPNYQEYLDDIEKDPKFQHFLYRRPEFKEILRQQRNLRKKD